MWSVCLMYVEGVWGVEEWYAVTVYMHTTKPCQPPPHTHDTTPTPGFLPFSAIYVELYYILVSAWGHKLYTPPFSILFIMFVILLLVTAFITVALTYFQLAAEDHRWWWRSFLCGGSTGIFLFGYCVYFFLYRSDMRGFYQVRVVWGGRGACGGGGMDVVIGVRATYVL